MEFNQKRLSFYSNIFRMLQASKVECTIARLRWVCSFNGQEFRKALDYLLDNNLVYRERGIGRRRRKHWYYRLTDEGRYLLSFYEEEENRNMRKLRVNGNNISYTYYSTPETHPELKVL